MYQQQKRPLSFVTDCIKQPHSVFVVFLTQTWYIMSSFCCRVQKRDFLLHPTHKIKHLIFSVSWFTTLTKIVLFYHFSKMRILTFFPWLVFQNAFLKIENKIQKNSTVCLTYLDYFIGFDNYMPLNYIGTPFCSPFIKLLLKTFKTKK